MKAPISLRPVEVDDLRILFAHQIDPEAARLAAFTPRNWDAFLTHWTTHIIGNAAAVSRAILVDGCVAGNIGAWTDAQSHERFISYWIGREFWRRGIASAAMAQFLPTEPSRPLHARVAQHNPGSIRVLEKSGFMRVGIEVYLSADGTSIIELAYLLPSS